MHVYLRSDELLQAFGRLKVVRVCYVV